MKNCVAVARIIVAFVAERLREVKMDNKERIKELLLKYHAKNAQDEHWLDYFDELTTYLSDNGVVVQRECEYKVEYKLTGEEITCTNCGFTKSRNRNKDMQGYMELGQFSLLERAKVCPNCGAKIKRGAV